ncbi:MAG: transposase [Candidatus Paceibacterota bacterium]|jgi:putative transposase
MDRAPIEEDTFHHVYNRGVDKRTIFEDDADHRRFILYLNVLNDTQIESPNTFEALERRHKDSPLGERLVNICAFCLMPNHFHLLLHERTPGGISKFMQRLGTAYTLYFNEKHKRSGALFQGRYKNRIIDDEEYLLHVIDYIHCNPNSIAGVEEYLWSSYHDFCGSKKFKQLLGTDVLSEFTEIPKNYASWLRSRGNFSEIKHITIDES